LIAVKQGLNTLAAFTYDASGLRATKTAGAITSTYIYESGQVAEERNSADGTIRYFFGEAVDDVLAKQDSTGNVYYVKDHIRSVHQITNATGDVITSRDYDAWGSPLDGATEGGFAFTGREWDPETGLYYYRMRYYDSAIGRFISEDPSGLDGGINRFRYVRNSPTNYVDPLGLKDCVVDDCMQNCLEQIFEQPIPNVRIIQGSKTTFFMKLIGKGGTAISHPNSVRIPGPCEEFLSSYWWVLHEYFHVVMQWRAAKPNNLTKKKYLANPGKWENPASNFADLYESTLKRCHEECTVCR
jgi:RHS repeat-associated protein